MVVVDDFVDFESIDLGKLAVFETQLNNLEMHNSVDFEQLQAEEGGSCNNYPPGDVDAGIDFRKLVEFEVLRDNRGTENVHLADIALAEQRTVVVAVVVAVVSSHIVGR